MRIGVGYPFDLSLSAARAFVRGADDAGVDTIWVYENPTWPGAFSTAGAVTMLTSRARIGIGTVSPFTRNPVVLAMEVAQLQALSQGRAVIGLGAGPAQTLTRWGIDTGRPVAAMTETAEYLKRAVAGETVTFDGRFVHAEDVTLGFPASGEEVRILFGTIGEKLSEAAGRVADGLIVSNHAPLSLVATTVSRARDAAASDGRDPRDITVVAYVPFSLRRSSSEAHRALKPSVARTVARIAGNDALERMYGTDDILGSEEIRHIATGVAAGADPAELVSDDVIDRLCISGDEANVADRIAEYAAAGVDELVLFELSESEDPVAAMRQAVKLAGA